MYRALKTYEETLGLNSSEAAVTMNNLAGKTLN